MRNHVFNLPRCRGPPRLRSPASKRPLSWSADCFSRKAKLAHDQRVVSFFVTIMKFNISKVQVEVAPLGQQQGVIVDAYPDTVPDKNGKIMTKLTLVTQLATHNKNGTRFAVPKTYTLGSRGKGTLTSDMSALLGRALTQDETTAFDPEALLIGKRCAVQIAHGLENGKLVAKVASFALPDGTELGVQPDYQRKKVADNATA